MKVAASGSIERKLSDCRNQPSPFLVNEQVADDLATLDSHLISKHNISIRSAETLVAVSRQEQTSPSLGLFGRRGCFLFFLGGRLNELGEFL